MRRSTRTSWSAVGTIALAIVGGSLLPLPFRRRPAFDVIGPDKALHLLGYCSLAVAIADALTADGVEPTRGAILAVAWSTAIGIVTGTLQDYVPGRAHERADVAAGALGSVLGVLYWYTRPTAESARPDMERTRSPSTREIDRASKPDGEGQSNGAIGAGSRFEPTNRPETAG